MLEVHHRQMPAHVVDVILDEEALDIHVLEDRHQVQVLQNAVVPASVAWGSTDTPVTLKPTASKHWGLLRRGYDC